MQTALDSHGMADTALGAPLDLDEAQVAQFRRCGYTIARGAVGASDLATIEAWCGEVLALPEQSGRHWVYGEASLLAPGERIVSRIEKISPFHAGFQRLTEALAVPAAHLLGEAAVLFKEKINFKLPGGDGFKPHQDSQAGWDRYADFYVSALLSIDAATPENGCLQIVENYEHRGLFASWQPLGDDDLAGMRMVDLPTEPGDVVFFDSFVPHGSQPNRTGDARRIYYATYNRASAGDHMAQYYADKHASYPPDIDRVADKEYVFRV